MSPERITITPAPAIAERVRAYAERHGIGVSEVYTHVSARLEAVAELAQEMSDAIEGTDHLHVAGFREAGAIIERQHRAVSEEFLGLWTPVRVAPASGEDGEPVAAGADVATPGKRFRVWLSWGDEVFFTAESELDALNQYAKAMGYARFDDLEYLHAGGSLEVEPDASGEGPLRLRALFENGYIFAQAVES